MNIDLERYLGTIEREAGVGERDGRPVRTVTLGRTYDTSVEDVWDAITQPERIVRWFLPVSGELRLGGRYQIKGNASGEITDCEPPSRLAITWEYGGDISWVRIGLTAVDSETTRLRLEHEAHVPDDFWDQYGPGATGVGWDLALVGLGEHIFGAADVDPKEAELWPTTTNGTQWVEHCSEAWSRASIASGTADAAAQDAAKRTFAFYTGKEPSA